MNALQLHCTRWSAHATCRWPTSTSGSISESYNFNCQGPHAYGDHGHDPQQEAKPSRAECRPQARRVHCTAVVQGDCGMATPSAGWCGMHSGLVCAIGLGRWSAKWHHSGPPAEGQEPQQGKPGFCCISSITRLPAAPRSHFCYLFGFNLLQLPRVTRLGPSCSFGLAYTSSTCKLQPLASAWNTARSHKATQVDRALIS